MAVVVLCMTLRFDEVVRLVFIGAAAEQRIQPLDRSSRAGRGIPRRVRVDDDKERVALQVGSGAVRGAACVSRARMWRRTAKRGWFFGVVVGACVCSQCVCGWVGVRHVAGWQCNCHRHRHGQRSVGCRTWEQKKTAQMRRVLCFGRQLSREQVRMFAQGVEHGSGQ